jgi:hypothetical protein
LFGVAVLNGIVLIAEFNRLKKEGIHDLIQIIMKGTSTRLRPVLMTALVASLGFLPMALSHGSGAEVRTTGHCHWWTHQCDVHIIVLYFLSRRIISSKSLKVKRFYLMLWHLGIPVDMRRK